MMDPQVLNLHNCASRAMHGEGKGVPGQHLYRPGRTNGGRPRGVRGKDEHQGYQDRAGNARGAGQDLAMSDATHERSGTCFLPRAETDLIWRW
jgi:hypothetical protein